MRAVVGLFQVSGGPNDRGLRQAVVLFDLRRAASGKVSGRPEGNGFYFRDLLPDKPAATANNINGFAPTGLFHQAAQLSLGFAQREHLSG